VRVLNDGGFDEFKVQRVLELAEVSRATLYHHFPDVETLVEAALAETFSQEIDFYRSMLTDLMGRSDDYTSFRDHLRAFLELHSTLPAVVRLRRAHTIALSPTRPALAAALATAQDAITDAWEETVREAQRRGFVRPDLDSRALAVMVQAIPLGRVLDDIAISRVGGDRWAAVFFTLLDRGALADE
jgi:AcrR family transcriptional regulator